MTYTASQISQVLETSTFILPVADSKIAYLAMDTRKLIHPEETLFFALKGSMHDGHKFVKDAIEKGVRNIVTRDLPDDLPEDVNVFVVTDSLKALQTVAAWHKSLFPELVTLAITGSNGKTTVKEWLSQMIIDRQVVKSPKSYNSQTGVALSLWQITEMDRLGIFEAGISTVNEMATLEAMIRPNIGLLTMIGDAHAEGFQSIHEKLKEKLCLFSNCDTIIYNADDTLIDAAIRDTFPQKTLLSFGYTPASSLFRIVQMSMQQQRTIVTVVHQDSQYDWVIPFADKASVQNALHCIAVMLVLGIDRASIQDGLYRIQNIPMRLELKFGINNNILIDDTYNADLQSLKIALDFLDQQAGIKDKVVILSDFLQIGTYRQTFDKQLADQLNTHKVQAVIGVGKYISGLQRYLHENINFQYVDDTETLLANLSTYPLVDKAILIKGARVFELEKITHALSDKAHTAVLETDLQAIEHNLRVFSQHLHGNTRIISVIKASAYGSGSEELAKYLEFKKVTYVAVAFVDEGVQLRKTGIRLPIIILNPDKQGIPEMLQYQLEPEIYDINQLKALVSYFDIGTKDFKIHLKLDTGMHRLGFLEDNLEQLCQLLKGCQNQIKVQTIFSHLSSSEDPKDDTFTHHQAQVFQQNYDFISKEIGYKPDRHLLNSSGIIRFPEYHFEYVRLGLGLYGIDSTNIFTDKLEKVHTLKATVVQIKNIKSTDSVGYNRKGKAAKNGQIAIINIGYADGLMRLAGNGRYHVRIQGCDYPIMGSVCMDLTIVDIGRDSGINVGDEVIIFGKDKPIEHLAEACQTIPYEILTRISSRIKRTYVNE